MESSRGLPIAHGTRVEEYRSNLKLIIFLMTVNLLWIILAIMIFPIPEEQSESLGTGGAFMCLGLWIGLIVTFSATLVWMAIKNSVDAATLGCLMALLFFIALISFGYSLWELLFFSIFPASLIAGVVKMLVLLQKIGEIKTFEPTTDYPVAPNFKIRP
jgi:hypothetical protein